MKQIVSNYSYSPATNVVTLSGVNIDADQLLLIVAPQVGRTLYNFASVTGTVSAGADTRVSLNASTAGLTTTSPLVIFYDDQASAQTVTGTVALDPASLVALENVTVTIGSSVTIAGTVTANAFGYDSANSTNRQIPILPYNEAVEGMEPYVVPVQISNTFGAIQTGNPLPISGTVTANNPSGALTTRFGSVTTANTAQITSAVTNTSRKYLLAQNISAGTVTIGIGFSPTTTQGIQLTAGGGLTFDAFCPTGAVYWLGAVTGAAYTILEG